MTHKRRTKFTNGNFHRAEIVAKKHAFFCISDLTDTFFFCCQSFIHIAGTEGKNAFKMKRKIWSNRVDRNTFANALNKNKLRERERERERKINGHLLFIELLRRIERFLFLFHGSREILTASQVSIYVCMYVCVHIRINVSLLLCNFNSSKIFTQFQWLMWLSLSCFLSLFVCLIPTLARTCSRNILGSPTLSLS